MGFTTSYWQKERWSRRVADMLTSYELCWNPSLCTWDVSGAPAWNASGENEFGTCLDPDLAGVGFCLQSWACGAAGSALPWHGKGRRFDPHRPYHPSSCWIDTQRNRAAAKRGK